MTRYVIVGCGAAGNSAAEAIRKLDPDSEIRMFTKEAAFYYYRPALPEYLAGEKTLKGFTLHDGAWYEKNRIDVHLLMEIVRIDPGARTVATKEGPLLTIGFFWRRAARPRDRTSRAPMHRVSSRSGPWKMPMPS